MARVRLEIEVGSQTETYEIDTGLDIEDNEGVTPALFKVMLAALAPRKSELENMTEQMKNAVATAKSLGLI